MFPLILLYLVFVIIRPQDFLPGMGDLPLMSVSLLLAFVGWLTAGARTPTAPQFLLLPLFVLMAMASEVANGWAGGMLYVLGQLGPAVIVFFVLASSITEPRRAAAAFTVIGLSAMVLALHSMQQAQHGVGWTGMTLGEDGRVRYVGIFNDPNDLGLLFVMALPMVLYLASRAGFLGRWFWRAGALLLLFGVYLTQSRGTQLAVLLMIAVYLWQRRGAATAAFLSLGGLVGLMLLPSSRMTELDVDEPSAFGRVDAWYEGLDMFKTHPLLGVGAGNFTDYNTLTAHNSFVLVLAETGFLGFLAWLAFVGYCFWMMWRLLHFQPAPVGGADAPGQAVAAPRPVARGTVARRAPAPAAAMDVAAATDKALALTLLCALCGFFAAAFFLSRSYNIMLYTLAALVVGHYASVRQRHAALPLFTLSGSGWRWLPITTVAVAALYVLVAVLLRTS